MNTVLFAPGLSNVGSANYKVGITNQWVQDSAGNVYWLETSTDTDGNVSFTYYDQPGGSVVTPTGDVQPVQDSNVQVIKRADDINSDGSVYVNFYRVNVYDEDGAILASLPQNAQGATYVILGDEVDPQDETQDILRDVEDRTPGSFINFNFDEVDLTYVAAGAAQGELETAVYKLNTATVGTVTLTYDGAGNLTNVARS